jgi:hypothetical protein
MTHLARSAAVLSPTRALATDIEHVVSATFARLDANLVALRLGEPRARDTDLAALTIDRLIETLTGLAIGNVIGAVRAGVRRGFGGALRATIEQVMRNATATLEPAAAAPLYAMDDAPVRSLGAELVERLRGRIALAQRDAGAVLEAITAAIESADPSELGPFGRILGLLAEDEVIAERYARQVIAGWACACAVIEQRPAITTEPVWQQWARKISGVREIVTPTRTQLAASGFVMRIE